MPDGSVQRGLTNTPESQALLVGVVGAAALALTCLLIAKPELAAVPVVIVGVALTLWAVWYVAAHPTWLICPLILIELSTATWFLSGQLRAAFHYGLVGLFCLPLLPAVWRNRPFRQGGFALYGGFFLWAAVTVLYSLAPAFSIGRLINAAVVFGALSLIAVETRDRRDVSHLIARLLLGCSITVGAVLLSAIALSGGLTWVVPAEGEDLVGGALVRFRGIFNGPNDVGELMLITVGCAAVMWPSVHGRRRVLLALVIAGALGAAALADSRTPFVALAAGAVCYLIWRYRARAVAILLAVLLAGAVAYFSGILDSYVSRGDVTTLTGRTDVWNFALEQIKRRPMLGYGYAVAGAILDSRYFPVWWGPWDEGPRSSLHNGYIDRAIGVGVPATLFWLFIILRPWYDVLRRRDDRWGLKPIAFWMVVPMLVHNLTESSIGDFTAAIGLSFALVWVLAERSRILSHEEDQARQREKMAQSPPAVAALMG